MAQRAFCLPAQRISTPERIHKYLTNPVVSRLSYVRKAIPSLSFILISISMTISRYQANFTGASLQTGRSLHTVLCKLVGTATILSSSVQYGGLHSQHSWTNQLPAILCIAVLDMVMISLPVVSPHHEF